MPWCCRLGKEKPGLLLIELSPNEWSMPYVDIVILLLLLVLPSFFTLWVHRRFTSLWVGWCVLIGAVSAFVLISVVTIGGLMAVGISASAKGVFNGSTSSSMSALRDGADRGNVVSQEQLGYRLLSGAGVPKDTVFGLTWLYVASLGGNAHATSAASSQERLLPAEVVTEARRRAFALRSQIIAEQAAAQPDKTIPAVVPSSE